MRSYWISFTALLLIGCQQKAKLEVDVTPPPRVDTNLELLPAVLAGIPRTAEVVLYEGLPSDFWEPELWEQELKRKKTVRLHGYPLYEERLAFEGTDADQVTALLSARGSFVKYDAAKTGGGFHPEYCVEWKQGEETTRALICLECSEVKLHGPKSAVHCDLMPGSAKKLKQLLTRYHKNCPIPKSTS